MVSVIFDADFDQPTTLAAMLDMEQADRWCMDVHDCRGLIHSLSMDARRGLCLYEAPDAEAVRRALDSFGNPGSLRAWTASSAYAEGYGRDGWPWGRGSFAITYHDLSADEARRRFRRRPAVAGASEVRVLGDFLSLDGARAAVSRMVDAGVGRIVTTPHFDASLVRTPERFEARMQEMDDGFAALIGAVQEDHPELELHRGQEVMLDDPFPDLSDPRLRLAGTRFVLVEWPRLRIPPSTPEVLAQIGAQDFLRRTRPQIEIDQLGRAGAQALGHIFAGDDEILAPLVLAPHDDMRMGMAGIEVIDRGPVEPRSQIALDLFHPAPDQRLQILIFRAVFGRDNEAELVPITAAAAPITPRVPSPAARSSQRSQRGPAGPSCRCSLPFTILAACGCVGSFRNAPRLE